MKEQYSYGLISFCAIKNINPHFVVCWFLKENNLPIVNRQKVINDNWNQFANFVDKKLKSGELKGNDVKTSHMDYDNTELKKRAAESKTIPPQFKKFGPLLRDVHIPSVMSKFYHINGLGTLPRQNEGYSLRLGKQLRRLENLESHGLLEQFEEYLKNYVG